MLFWRYKGKHFFPVVPYSVAVRDPMRCQILCEEKWYSGPFLKRTAAENEKCLETCAPSRCWRCTRINVREPMKSSNTRITKVLLPTKDKDVPRTTFQGVLCCSCANNFGKLQLTDKSSSMNYWSLPFRLPFGGYIPKLMRQQFMRIQVLTHFVYINQML